jgi:hypothetical protein
MRDPFCSFAKRLIRYLQGLRPTQNQQQRLCALRALEHALAENGLAPDICNADAGIFNRAVQLAKERFSKLGAYRIGAALEIIAELVAKKRLTNAPVIAWRNPVKRPGDSVRVGKEFEERRQAKLPSPAALEALPKVFQLAQSSSDRIITAITALLCSAPDRINEVLVLPDLCEVSQNRGSKGKAYGLRWWPAKGAEPMIKWIVPSMVSVVEEALARLRTETRQAHLIALWYEAHPTEIYLPDELQDLRQRPLLSLEELQDVIGLATPDGARQWCSQNDLTPRKCGNRLFAEFDAVENAVIAMLPRDFPILDKRTGLTYSKALMVIRRNEFHPRRATYRCMIEPITIQHVNDGIGSRIEHGMSSIFSRHGFVEPNGQPIKITTHQFRHYLNTLAQVGGLSQLDIAKWSGRKDARQNAAYDHVSADELLGQVREAIGDDRRMVGPLAELPRHLPVSREVFARLQAPTAHTTDFGFCLHDFTMLPCQHFRDCINCVEHVCPKGDNAKTENVRQRLEETKVLYARAKAAATERLAGSDRWAEHHQSTIARLEQLYELLTDPSISDGSLIQLSTPQMSSAIRNAMDDQEKLTDPALVDPVPQIVSQLRG